jgi:hypothetical protein
MKGQMAIGTIDCTIHKNLCEEHGVRGYPTLKFTLDGEIYDYPGGRTADDLLEFAERIGSKEKVQVFKTAKEALEYVEHQTDEGVAFLAYHPRLEGGSTDEMMQTSAMTQVYGQVARKQMAFGSFLLLQSDAPDLNLLFEDGNVPNGQFLCRVETGVAPRCYDKVDTDINLADAIAFVKENNVATVSRLSGQNFHKVGKAGRPMVIGVVDTNSEEQVATVKRELRRYATEGPEDMRKKYYFGWFDGKQFQKFLAQFNVHPADLPQVFVLDVPNKKYWQNETYKLNVDDFLLAVEDGKVPVGKTGKKGIEGALERFANAMVDYRPWSAVIAIFLIVLVGVLLLVVLSPASDLRPSYNTDASDYYAKKEKAIKVAIAKRDGVEPPVDEPNEPKKTK